MPALTLVTAPAEEPCSLAELRSWAREPSAEDNGELHELQQGARQLIERLWGLQLVQATWRLDTDDFLSWDGALGVEPVSEIVSITYIDTSEVERALASSVYELSTGLDPAVVRLAYGEVWPDVLYQAQSVSVTFKAGWPNGRLVPALLRKAVAATVAYWYEQRDRVGELPEGAKGAVRAYWNGVS